MSISEPSPHFWNGRLAAAMGEASKTAQDDPKWTRKYLLGALSEYVASPAPSEQLRVILREYLK